MQKQLASKSANSTRRINLLWRSTAFALIFIVLQRAFESNSAQPVVQWVINKLIVQSAATIIDWLDPGALVFAAGSRLQSPNAGINILNGCDGMDVLFLLAAAITVTPATWIAKIKGILFGTLTVWLVNLTRIIGLFYSFRYSRDLFDILHGLVTPVILMAIVSVYFVFWLGGNSSASYASDGIKSN